MEELTHINEQGRARMVDVTDKSVTCRTAVAAGEVHVSPETMTHIKNGTLKKGDVLAVAQVAGIMAAKRTADYIPLCHPVAVDGIDLTLALDEVELNRVHLYGIMGGEFTDEEARLMQVSSMVEKPAAEYAQEHLGVKDETGAEKYYCVFGQYILPPRVFELLERNVQNYDGMGEIELTTVLDEVRATEGMTGYRVNGRRYDIGVPEEYRKTLSEFGKG